MPRLAFGGVKEKKGKILMPVSINVNHALVDGYHVGQFFKKFQLELDKLN